jgi:hypothetical protein
VFLFGGIDFEQFLVTQVLTATTAVSIAAVSLFLSAVFRRTLPSTVVAYGVAFAGMIGTAVAGLLFSFTAVVRSQATVASSGGDYHPLLFGNPFYALWVTLSDPTGSPVHIGRLLQLMFFMGGTPSAAGPSIEPWQAVVLVQVALVALSIVGAIHLVQSRRAPTPPWRPSEALEPVPAGDAPGEPVGTEVGS